MKETTRPTFYRTMKYWGKKPHNIWNAYIKKYTKKNGVVLDPFAGSGMTYFEANNLKRIPITIDINPVTDLIIKSLLKKVNEEELVFEANKIIDEVKLLKYYKINYLTVCSNCGSKTDIMNYKNKYSKSYEVSYRCSSCFKTISDPSENHDKLIKFDMWVPNTDLTKLDSINSSFLKRIENKKMFEVWSYRNGYLLSHVYSKILMIKDQDIKTILVFAFIQGLHLSSKMCVTRGVASKRPLSTSWGRPAYMIPQNNFEQNPIYVFEKSIFGKSGVLSAMDSIRNYLNINDLKGKHILGNSIEVIKEIESNSIDLVLTDPPYSDIIQYGDLSEVWVSWLEKFDSRYKIDHSKEIIVNKNKSHLDYKDMLLQLFVEIKRVLKNDAKFILTFNSSKLIDWIMLLEAVSEGGFSIDKLTLQENKRSSESNVRSTSGKAISDYYIICSKSHKSFNAEEFIEESGLIRYVR